MVNHRNGPIDRAITFATAVAGLAAYLYLLGGVVSWLHLRTAQLSADAGVVAIDSKRLLSVGCRVAAFEVGLLVLVSTVVAVIVGFALKRRGKLPKRPAADWLHIGTGWRDLWTLGGMIGLAIPSLAIALGLSVSQLWLRVLLLAAGGLLGLAVAFAMVLGSPPKNRSAEWPPRWRRGIRWLGDWIRRKEQRMKWMQRFAAVLILVNLGAAVWLVPAFQGVLLLAATVVIYAGPFLTWPTASQLSKLGPELVKSSGPWIAVAALTAVAVAWVATPPVAFTRAEVSTGTGSLVGAYVERTSNGVDIATCQEISGEGSGSARIRSIKNEDVRELTLGGGQYRFDTGGRPSLFQMAAGSLTSRSPLRDDAPLGHAIRGRASEVCGG